MLTSSIIDVRISLMIRRLHEPRAWHRIGAYEITVITNWTATLR
jgi:hypothetical protein